MDEHRDDRLQMTQDVLKQKPSAYWLDRFDRFNVPHAPVLTRKEMINHPQIGANDLIIETEHVAACTLRQTRSPVIFDGTPLGQPVGAPWLGQHTRQVMSELGYNEAEIGQMLAKGSAHADLKSLH